MDEPSTRPWPIRFVLAAYLSMLVLGAYVQITKLRTTDSELQEFAKAIYRAEMEKQNQSAPTEPPPAKLAEMTGTIRDGVRSSARNGFIVLGVLLLLTLAVWKRTGKVLALVLSGFAVFSAIMGLRTTLADWQYLKHPRVRDDLVALSVMAVAFAAAFLLLLTPASRRYFAKP